MKKIKILTLVLIMLLQFDLLAQKQEISDQDYQNDKIEMADQMRSEGKIYVLVAIIVTIFAGFVFYTAVTERKIKKLEKTLKEHD